MGGQRRGVHHRHDDEDRRLARGLLPRGAAGQARGRGGRAADQQRHLEAELAPGWGRGAEAVQLFDSWVGVVSPEEGLYPTRLSYDPPVEVLRSDDFALIWRLILLLKNSTSSSCE